MYVFGMGTYSSNESGTTLLCGIHCTTNYSILSLTCHMTKKSAQTTTNKALLEVVPVKPFGAQTVGPRGRIGKGNGRSGSVLALFPIQ